MDTKPPDSKALLVRKRSDTDLMLPPPPVKKIKRPKQILDEDNYTGSLSYIIKRDFFPGIDVSAIQNEYLDAVQARDAAWISSASRRLQQAMTPGRRKVPSASRLLQVAGRTPTTYVGETPTSVAPSIMEANLRLVTNMGLTQFQTRYTSEDNESFYKLVDKQNQKKADKNAWLWNNNKLPSKQMVKQKEVTDKLEKTRSLVDDGFKRDRLAIKDVDERPARPDTWHAAPRNGLMFEPDGLEEGVVTMAQRAEETSRMAPKAIMYENTRIPQPHEPHRPPSPTLSAVRDAVAGRPRRRDQDSSVVGGGETPRVKGYAFVDDEPDVARPWPDISLGPGDAHNPFKLQKQRKRESLHEQLVERIAKSNKESSRNGLLGKAEEQLPVPKFPSSPRVSGKFTPAARRLLSNMGTRKNKAAGGPFSEPTPLKRRGALSRSVARPGSRRD